METWPVWELHNFPSKGNIFILTTFQFPFVHGIMKKYCLQCCAEISLPLSLHHLFQCHVEGNHSPLAFSHSWRRDVAIGSSSSQHYHFSQWQQLLQTINLWKNFQRIDFEEGIYSRAWKGTPSNRKSHKGPGKELRQTTNLSSSLHRNSFNDNAKFILHFNPLQDTKQNDDIKKSVALTGNWTQVSHMGSENSTTELPMP